MTGSPDSNKIPAQAGGAPVIPGHSIPKKDFSPNDYRAQLDKKVATCSALLRPLGSPAPDVFESPALGFRMRAEFRLWHDRRVKPERCFYAMFQPHAPREPVEITAFPIACEPIGRRMAPLLEAINAKPELSHKLFQVEFLASRSDEVVISLIYHRQLDERWQDHARALEKKLDASIIGRARKQRLVLSRAHVTESVSIRGSRLSYEQCENSFTQPNAVINEKMINWVSAQIQSIQPSLAKRDLLELYCGNGNFTLALASQFRKVLGTEISKSSIASAQRNALDNSIYNTAFVRMSSAETASALRNERAYRRLEGIDLTSYAFAAVLVDPPRAGLDGETLSLVRNFDYIIYISCNPETLARDLASLRDKFKIMRTAVFDQFPYTAHCEAGVILSKHSACTGAE